MGFLQSLQSEILVLHKSLKYSVRPGKSKNTAFRKAFTLGNEIPVSDAINIVDFKKKKVEKPPVSGLALRNILRYISGLWGLIHSFFLQPVPNWNIFR